MPLLVSILQPIVKSHVSCVTENTVRVYVNTSRLMVWREIVCVMWDLRKTRIHCLQKKKENAQFCDYGVTVTTRFRAVCKTL